MHHVLLSTVIFDSVNHECAWIPLTKHWMFLPKVYVFLFLFFQPISVSFSVNWNYYDYSFTFTMNVIILKTLTSTVLFLHTWFAFFAFVCIGLATFNAVTKPKNIFFETVIVQPTNFHRRFFFITFYLFYEWTKYKSITKRPRLVFIYCILQRRNQQDYNFLLMGNPTWSCIS